jgi:hypothetical protein
MVVGTEVAHEETIRSRHVSAVRVDDQVMHLAAAEVEATEVVEAAVVAVVVAAEGRR